MSDEASFTVRRLKPSDAPGVVSLVKHVYGATYVHPELYDAEQIIQRNAREEMVSAVAIDVKQRVVGHYALLRPDLGDLAESGEAMVLPEVRHHELMERMRVVLEKEATRLRLVGIFGHVVTNHVFSQRVVERFGESPWAVLLGWSPQTFHNMAQSLPQRMSELLYFKYLGDVPVRRVNLPQRHRQMCELLYAQLGTAIVQGNSAVVAAGPGELCRDERPDVQRGILRIRRIGDDTADAVAAALRDMQDRGIEAVYVHVPLAQSAAPQLCEKLESLGFFFSGIGPSFAEDGDFLLLQWLGAPIDLSHLQVDQPLARALTEYVGRERDRVKGRP
jgi:hypothetical protein